MSVAFVRPDRRGDIADIQEIHRIDSNFEVWTVDCEFGTARNAHAIPYSLTVRNAKTEEFILSTSEEYDQIYLQELEDEIQHHNRFSNVQTPHFLGHVTLCTV